VEETEPSEVMYAVQSQSNDMSCQDYAWKCWGQPIYSYMTASFRVPAWTERALTLKAVQRDRLPRFTEPTLKWLKLNTVLHTFTWHTWNLSTNLVSTVPSTFASRMLLLWKVVATWLNSDSKDLHCRHQGATTHKKNWDVSSNLLTTHRSNIMF